ncbi:LIP-domain-containing protein [Violaceomyces palustris]|uniref:LIP-domain-containing protein n=1 Tax=Violaceomyces palustris TaxID=1673888 RepID=A0ACD0NTN7_9BASI|nr:LIP-domain-containing protein [Violaceomyces palustris]
MSSQDVITSPSCFCGDNFIEPPLVPPSQDKFYSDRPASFDSSSPGTVLRSRRVGVVKFDILPTFGSKVQGLKCWQVAFKTLAQDGRTPQVSVALIIRPILKKKRAPTRLSLPFWSKKKRGESITKGDVQGKTRLKGEDYDKVVCYQSKCDSASPDCRTTYALRKGNGGSLGALGEVVFIEPFLDRGWTVVVPDYESERDAFGAGPQAGRAVLDSLKATFNFEPLDLNRSRARVVLFGYSGGAQASGWASCLKSAYAPELPIVGSAFGGTPVDLEAIAYKVDGGIASGLIVGVIQGLSNIYPDLQSWSDDNLTEEGKIRFKEASENCFGKVMLSNFMKVVLGSAGKAGGYFKPKNPLKMKVPKRVLSENLLGDEAQPVPDMPIYIYQSLHDEVVPFETVDKLVEKWGAKGATIEYTRDELSAHMILAFTGTPRAMEWLEDRMKGKPNPAQPGKPLIRTVVTSLADDSSVQILGKKRRDRLENFMTENYVRTERIWWT